MWRGKRYMIEAVLEKYFSVVSSFDSSYIGFFRGNPEIVSKKMQDELALNDIYASVDRVGEAYRVTLFHIPAEKRRIWIHVLLGALTVITTLFAGAFNSGHNPVKNPLELVYGMPFSLSLMLILGLHEMGHYLASRKRGIKATLPYFLPVPHPLIGTMGAFIKVKSPITHKDALMEIGAMGPIVGFIVALPISVIGIYLSRVIPSVDSGVNLKLGTPIVFKFLTQIIHGNISEGYDIMLHPVAFAGWLGMFVTSLNLLPIGQLDGGHVTFALFGNAHRAISRIAFIILLLLGFYWPGWWFWDVMLVFIGIYHPPILNQIAPLSKKDKIIGILAIIIFFLTFVPVPFSFQGV